MRYSVPEDTPVKATAWVAYAFVMTTIQMKHQDRARTRMQADSFKLSCSENSFPFKRRKPSLSFCAKHTRRINNKCLWVVPD